MDIQNKSESDKSIKKALTYLLIFTGILFACVIILVVSVDPFFHFHSPLGEVYLYNERYQDPGMAKNFSYDTLMIGSSMTENFKPSWFNEYGENAIKLSYSGARSKDIKKLLEESFESKNEIRHVYIDINDYQLSEDPSSQFSSETDYLYDDDYFNDIQYVFNKDVIIASLERVYALLVNSFARDVNNDALGTKIAGIIPGNLDEAFTWEEEELFGRDKVLEDYELGIAGRDRAWVNEEEDLNALISNALLNVENLTQIIDEHKDVRFTVFYPPYSSVYWYDLKNQGIIEKKMDMYRASIERLLENDNVEIFFFMDDYEDIANLEQYRDMCHYAPNVNRYMLQCMQDGTFLLDVSNIEERFERLKEYILEYEP